MEPFIIDNAIIDGLPKATDNDLQKLAAVHRINCLAGLKKASHGWLGACFSSMELLTAIYHRYIHEPQKPLAERGSVHLSKGHAAMAQYAVLAGLNCFSTDRLASYKQLHGLPAHCDRSVPGVDSDSGSLGQGLSKAVGIALSNAAAGHKHPVFAIIGDGEMQEGQLFEAFLTLRRLNPGMVVPIIDRNHLQSDSQTADIKDAEDWATVFQGIGLQVHEIDGHSISEICAAIDQILQSPHPGVIIARTVKGGGSTVTGMPYNTARRAGKWHGAIPDDREYLAIVQELTAIVSNQMVDAAMKAWLTGRPEAASLSEAGKSSADNGISTGEAFAEALLALAGTDRRVFILDADLEKSCKLTGVAAGFADRFIEVGISEQDMCSLAAGLGLAGNIAVVNTYGSFFKRSLDQIYACITEKVPVIFAAHYSGADYYTDGKSHQAINDLGLMLALNDIDIIEPVDAASTRTLLQKTIARLKGEISAGKGCRPAYFRLHRTPMPEFADLPSHDGYPGIFRSTVASGQRNVLFTSGPHMLKAGLDAAKALATDGICLDVVAIGQFSDQQKHLKTLTETAYRLFSLEDHRRESGVGSFIASLGFRNPVRIGARKYCQSALKLEEMLSEHCITAADVVKVVKKVLGCSHEK